jgi:hypothetical protein
MPGWEISGSRVGGRAQIVRDPRDIVGWKRGFAAERDGGLGAGIADDEIGIDPDFLTVATHGDALNAAIGRVNLYGRRLQPDIAIAADDRGQRIPHPDRALGTEAESLEGALAGEIGQERPRRQLVGIAGKDRRAEIAEQRVDRGIAGIGLEPVFGRLPPVRQIPGTGVGELLQDARGLFRQLTEQQRPAATADIHQFAVDEE